MLSNKGGAAYGSERYIHLNDFMRNAIRDHREDLVQYVIKLGFDDWNIPIEEYAEQGNIKAMNEYLSLSQYEYNFDYAAEGALRGKHKDLFDHVLSIAPEDYQWNWNELGAAAIESGSKELFDYSIMYYR